MNKTELIRRLAKSLEVTNGEAKRIIETFIEEMATILSTGERVTIQGFGRFEPRIRKAIIVRSNLNGEDVQVPERVRLRFTPSGKILNRLNDGILNEEELELDSDKYAEKLTAG